MHKMLFPVLKPLKALWVRYVIDHTAAVSAPIESRTQRLESLLASCVPNLENTSLVVNYDLSIGEISPYRWLEVI